MNFQSRFLILFADHREALEQAQRAQDESLRYRGQLEELQAKHDAMLADRINRETLLSDNLLRFRFGARVVPGADASSGVNPAYIPPPRQAQAPSMSWRSQTAQETLDKFEKLTPSDPTGVTQ